MSKLPNEEEAIMEQERGLIKHIVSEMESAFNRRGYSGE